MLPSELSRLFSYDLYVYDSWIFIRNSNNPHPLVGVGVPAENILVQLQRKHPSTAGPWSIRPSLRGPKGEPPIKAYDPCAEKKGSGKSKSNPWVSGWWFFTNPNFEKIAQVKLEIIFHKFWGENTKYLKPPPRFIVVIDYPFVHIHMISIDIIWYRMIVCMFIHCNQSWSSPALSSTLAVTPHHCLWTKNQNPLQ